MTQYRIVKQTDSFREIVNLDTGAVRKIPMASDKQFSFLQKLRVEAGKEPLKHRPPAYQASKAIDKLLAKKSKEENQQTLI
jgi:hypothetical protein